MPFGAKAPLPLRLGGSPTKGLTARQHARLCATMVALVRSSKLAVVTVEQTGVGYGSILSYNGQDGVGLSHAPAPSFDATGNIKLTFPYRWVDGYENSYPLHIRHCRVSCGTTVMREATYTILSPNVVRIYTFDAQGDPANTTVTVSLY